MSKGNTFETDFLALIFNATPIDPGAGAGLAQDNADPATSLYVSLHTGDPGEAGDQSTSETAYTGYARVAVARTAGGWTVSSPAGVGTVNPVANIDFGECSALPGVAITHFGVGTGASGAGYLIYSGTVTPNITMAVGVIPRLKTTSTITED